MAFDFCEVPIPEIFRKTSPPQTISTLSLFHELTRIHVSTNRYLFGFTVMPRGHPAHGARGRGRQLEPDVAAVRVRGHPPQAQQYVNQTTGSAASRAISLSTSPAPPQPTFNVAVVNRFSHLSGGNQAGNANPCHIPISLQLLPSRLRCRSCVHRGEPRNSRD